MTCACGWQAEVRDHAPGTGLVWLLYGVGWDGSPFLEADLDDITLEVRERRAGVSLAPASLVIADVVHDTPVTGDVRWDGGAQGYNLEVVVPGDAFPAGMSAYRASLLLTPSDPAGEPFAARLNVYTSTLQQWGTP